MLYRVVSLSLLDRPDWQVLDDHVKLGRVYYILDSTIQHCMMTNTMTGECRTVIAGIDIETGRAIPLDTMELVES